MYQIINPKRVVINNPMDHFIVDMRLLICSHRLPIWTSDLDWYCSNLSSLSPWLFNLFSWVSSCFVTYSSFMDCMYHPFIGVKKEP